jgi:hypothetical protein
MQSITSNNRLRLKVIAACIVLRHSHWIGDTEHIQPRTILAAMTHNNRLFNCHE